MRYVCLLVGMLFLGLAASYGWSWYVSGLVYPGSIGGTRYQLCVMIGGMILLGCGFTAAGIGGWKQAGLKGLFLGLICGPFGVIAAFFLDNRPKCLQCSGRLDSTARICPHCHAAFAPRKPSTKTDWDGPKNSDGPKKRNTEADQQHTDWMAGGRRKGN